MAELKVTQQVMISCATSMRSGAARLDELRDSVAKVRASDVLDDLPSSCKKRLAKVTNRMDDHVSIMTDMGGALDSAASRYGSAEETIQANHMAGFLSGIQAENTGTMLPMSATAVGGATMVVSTPTASSGYNAQNGSKLLDLIQNYEDSQIWGGLKGAAKAAGAPSMGILAGSAAVGVLIDHADRASNGEKSVAVEMTEGATFFHELAADKWSNGDKAGALGDIGMAGVCGILGVAVYSGDIMTEMASSVLGGTLTNAVTLVDEVATIVAAIPGCEGVGTAVSPVTEGIITGLGEVADWLSGLI